MRISDEGPGPHAPDLFAAVPHGTSPHQTYLRAVLLVVDHAAYHVGHLVLVRQLLGKRGN